jgi:medium-chain acyl-[acyl-carrier-protein] hydrolase
MSNLSNPQPWLPQRRASGPVRARLFCLPHAGGGAAPYHRWSGHFPANIELVPVKLPGREERIRERAIDRMPAMVAALTEALAGDLDLPFAVLGHSMGAIIAFELARAWRSSGIAPLCLFVAACPAPQLPRRSAAIHGLSEGEFLEKLQHRYQGIPGAVASNEELMRLLLPTLRADFSLVETYECQAGPPLACPILALAGDEDAEVTVADVSAWRQQTAAAFSLRIFPGNHFFLHQNPRSVVPVVVRHLESLLAHGPAA